MLKAQTTVGAGVVLGCLAIAAANPTDRFATWDNGGSGSLWSTANNWDPDFVPMNFGSFDFFVTIPGTSHTVEYDLPGEVTVTGLTIDANSRLNLGATGDLTVGTVTHADSVMHLGGILDSDGSIFDATLGDVAFIGNRARAFVSGGGVVTIASPSYDSRGLWADDGFTSQVSTYNWTLLESSGASTLLDLSDVTEINAGFNSSGNDRDYHHVNALSGGTIDLSGLALITAPNDQSDRIELNVDNGGVILLPALTQLTTVGKGYVQVDVTNAELVLPALGSIACTQFLIDGGGHCVANEVPAVFSSKCFWADDGFTSQVSTFNWVPMQASGAGTVLDLSTVTEINAGFNSSGNDRDYQSVSALNGGSIDLSSVALITAPNDQPDRIELNVDNGGVILLPALTQLTTVGKGYVQVDVTNADLVLPALGSIACTQFLIDGGGHCVANEVPAVFSSTCFWADDGFTSQVSTFNWVPMQASGAGTVLDLSTVTEINAGFNSSGNDRDYQNFNALNGAQLDLSGLERITTPADGQDRVVLNISGAATADLSSLGEIVSAGGGPLHVNLATGGSLTTGAWANVSATTHIVIDNDDPAHGGPPTTLHILGDLAASGSVDIDMTHPNTRLEVDGDMNVTGNIDLVAASGGTVAVGGDLTYGFTAENDLKLGCATVHFDGKGSGKQHYELGGFDVDVFVEFLPEGDHNFGLGQMVVGSPDRPTVVQLEDLLDNGNRAGADEVLYLWGNSLCETAPAEGLRIYGGSTLSLDGLNLYVYNFDPSLPGEWVHVNTRFPSGVNTIPYDDGFISLSAFPLDLLFDPPVFIEQIEEPTSAAAADMDGVNNDDLAITVLGPTMGENGNLVILLNDGTGLTYVRRDTEVGTYPSDVVLADFDGVNGPDAAVTDVTANNVTILLNDGQGTGGFGDPVTVGVGAAPSAIAAGDLDGMNGPDLAVANESDDSVAILENDGSGGFVVRATLVDNIVAPRDVAIGEFDGNPGLDVSISSAGSNTIVLYVNDGAGVLSFAGEFAVAEGPGPMDPADLDNDKDLDQVVGSMEAGETQNLINDGTGVFNVVPVPAANGANPTSLATEDLDDDGDLDILVVAGAGSERAIGVLRNDLVPGQQLTFARVLNLAPDPMLRFTLAAPLNDDQLPDIVAIQAIVEGLGAGGAVNVLINVSGLNPPPTCTGDADGDGDVGFGDVLRILRRWEEKGGPEDVDGDGTVGFGDVLTVLANWGPCPM